MNEYTAGDISERYRNDCWCKKLSGKIEVGEATGGAEVASECLNITLGTALLYILQSLSLSDVPWPVVMATFMRVGGQAL